MNKIGKLMKHRTHHLFLIFHQLLKKILQMLNLNQDKVIQLLN